MHASSAQAGSTSGRLREAERSFLGLELGLRTSIRPFGTRRVAVELSLHGAVHPLFGDEPVSDAYSPFQGTVGMAWATLGVAVELGLVGKAVAARDIE